MKIDIVTNSDVNDCETCGVSFAEGGSVTIDGNLIVDLPAIAHCFDGQSFSEGDLLVIALRKLGHTVNINGEDRFISLAYED